MPIRISRACACGLAVASLWFVAACAPTTPIRTPDPAKWATPEAAIAAAEAALQAGKLPEAARAYREAAQAS